ncbi:hemerythrin domain-containing protein [Micromonospora echinofusca]|uniref:Hemerythrin domain-containing protein n=1 Tax=Micromonospora echinofusca TaxID=47858 RepID=A0ABS3VX89_MICEH|nr:hemerythrin domain-containing protein [Micromonospora echinofusca]MBO4209162.1 hemerythrin domain-containing protein [Micromonospora echinofusca]
MPDQEDVVDLLLAQHARIEELFAAVLAGTGEARRESFHELVRLLAVHETAEEEIVHPLARRSIDAGDDVVEARLAEERAAKELLAELHDIGPDAPSFDSRIVVLRDAVLAHATYEERYEFPQLRHSVDADRLRGAARAVRAAEAVAPTRPHPGVESASANLLAGPAVAVFDRLRDAARDAMRH